MFDQLLTVRIARTAHDRRSPACSATMTAIAALLIGQRAALAAPLGGSVVEGSAGISQSGSVTNVNQSTNKAIINWQSFSVGASETVNFNQPGASSVTLNRVIGNETSVISGALNANGQVFIVNSAGVLFGKNAQVNVGGLVASTLDISNANFMAGNYTFSGNSPASVVNQGRIHAHGGGYVALLGNTVSNDGVISARLGTVAMAAGSQINLNFGGNSLLDVTIDRGTLNALVENKRAIIANGGQVIMTAKAADGVLSAQVNNSGIIQARTMAALTGGSGKTRAAKTGSIKLIADGGTTTVSGKLDASAPKGGDGGTVETSGNKVKIADSAVITTKPANGNNGTWTIDPDGFTIAASGGDISGATLSSNLTSTNVTLASTSGSGSDGNINVNDAVSWAANTILTLQATNNININAPITATGTSAGLVLNYGGNYNINMASGGSVTLSGANATLNMNGINYTLIHTMDQLAALSPSSSLDDASGRFLSTASGHYALAQDLSPTSDPTSNYNFTGPVIGALTGTLTGLGHSISGLVIHEDPHVVSVYNNNIGNNGGFTGLIGFVGTADLGITVVPTAVVRDIGITNATITAPSGTAGALVGQNLGTVSNAYVKDSTITGGTILGGLVGLNGGTNWTTFNPVPAVIRDSYAVNVVVSGSVGSTNIGGLVGASNQTTTLQNVSAIGVTVSGTQSVGGLVGSTAGKLTNGYANGSVAAIGSNIQYIGGVAGANAGTISNSHSGVTQLSVTGANGVGGLVGISFGSIDNSYADTAIAATNSLNVGGLVGINSSTITGSHATGDITVVAAASGGTGIGGLVGTSMGSTSISDSYATGNVTVTGAAAGSCPNDRCGIGGLVGFLGGGGTISGSHATGNVTAPDSSSVGGLVGDTGGSTIVNSYATGNVVGRSAVGGLVGRSTGLAFPSGKGSVFSGDHASGNVTSNDPNSANTGSLIGLADNTTVTNSAGSGRVSTVASRAQDAADAAAAAAEAAARAAAAKEAAAQTAQAASRSANTVASNAATSAATPPDPASSTAGTQKISSPAAARMDDSLKTIRDSVKADDERARRRVTAAVAAASATRRSRGNNGNGGSDLGATIRSIDIDGQRFDLQEGGKKNAPSPKP
ncbi:beta strand repeat-containing protein [Bradyrhizobium sp. HKCCYLS1011]|uniref:beta strand repeat-containing protein n=1 Tax=Bradyrhizobium sp. HKCCYLS1011 TaxID=3420733 RepID=UPI003EB76163